MYTVQPSMVDGMTEDEARAFSQLVRVWSEKREKNERRLVYYTSHNKLEDLGISIPPQLRNVETAVGWPAKAVDALASRSVFQGFSLGGEEDADLSAVLDENDFDIAYQQAVTSELIGSCAFATVSRGDESRGEPPVLVNFYSSLNAAALWDWRKKRIRCGFTIADYDEKDGSVLVPRLVNMHTDTHVIECVRDARTGRWSAVRRPHGHGRPLMEPMAYRPTLDRPFGKYRISRAVMSITDCAVRSALRAEVAAEFYTSPQRYLLGADEETFSDDPDGKKLKMWLGTVQVFTNNSEGEKPTYGQLTAMSMQPHVDYMRSLAARFAGETGIPVSMLGVIHDNPASADAMYAASEELIIETEWLNKTNGRALRNVALLVQAVMRDKTLDELDGRERSVAAHFANPLRPSMSASADASTKLAASAPGFSDTREFWEMNGFSDDEISSVKAQIRAYEAKAARDAAIMNGVSGGQAAS